MKYIFSSFTIFFSGFNFSQTYNGTGGAILDDGSTNNYLLNVSGLSPTNLNATHGLLTICVDITHTYDDDLTVLLISPDGTSVNLFSHIGGSNNNFSGTCLNDNAGGMIATGTPPFTGTFSAMDYIGDANNNQNGNGTWTLSIIDTYAFTDSGTLNSWSLNFGAGATTPITVDSTLLPLVLVETFGQTIVDEPKINVEMKIIHNGAGNYNHPTDAPNVYNGFVGIEIRGSYSASLPQKPYGFETVDNSGNKMDVPLLSMPSEHDWILLANYNDKSFVRNMLPYHLFNAMNHYAPKTELCEVLIDGKYQGIYILTEKIKRDKNRVDVAKLDLDDNAGDSLTGGYIIKIDYHNSTNSWQSNYSPIDHPTFDVYFVYYYPNELEILPPKKIYIQTFIDALETALYGINFTDPSLGYRNYINVRSFVDYFIINELARNNDGFKKSRYFHKDKDSKGGLLNAGPVWDFDWAWKNINECSIFSATDGSGWAYKINDCGPDVNSPGWYIRLMQDPYFVRELNCRYFTLRSTILDTTYLFDYIDEMAALVNDAQERHYAKWSTLGVNVGTPEIGTPAATYAQEIQNLKNWIVLRLNWLDANMPGTCPDVNTDELIINQVVFRAFPNPCTNFIFVESNIEMSMVQLINLEGKIVFSQMLNSEFSAELNLTDLSSGTYILNCFSDEEKISTQKIIINAN